MGVRSLTTINPSMAIPSCGYLVSLLRFQSPAHQLDAMPANASRVSLTSTVTLCIFQVGTCLFKGRRVRSSPPSSSCRHHSTSSETTQHSTLIRSALNSRSARLLVQDFLLSHLQKHPPSCHNAVLYHHPPGPRHPPHCNPRRQRARLLQQRADL
jgi:hypothetical protein